MTLPMVQDTPITRLTRSIDSQPKSSLPTTTSVVTASDVPTDRQTSLGVEALISTPHISAAMSGMQLSQIRSTRQAPSAVVTESFLAARAASAPVYIQNQSALKAERISNMFSEAPRFRNQVDLLA